jgi:hypothetical protein
MIVRWVGSGEHTKYRAIEDELVSTVLVALEDLDMDHTEDEVENEKDHRDRHIRHDGR